MSDSDTCIFCKIVRQEIPAREVARTGSAIAIRDLDPKAPVHLLVLPTRHASNLSAFAATARDDETVGGLFRLAAELGAAASPTGYRIVVNEGEDAGQTMFHLHLHVLAGRPMGWPPG